MTAATALRMTATATAAPITLPSITAACRPTTATATRVEGNTEVISETFSVFSAAATNWETTNMAVTTAATKGTFIDKCLDSLSNLS